VHKASDGGFTLIELIVVVLIIGILVAIVIPIVTGAAAQARRRACLSNERAVEGAYSSHVASEGLEVAATITDWPSLMSHLVPNDLHAVPVCPSGGTYTWTPSGDAVCSIHGTYH
jgi:prepilin-type N-terminal cleavage/methylation domain-containing protein